MSRGCQIAALTDVTCTIDSRRVPFSVHAHMRKVSLNSAVDAIPSFNNPNNTYMPPVQGLGVYLDHLVNNHM
jgi:hypothetical protein